MTRSEPSTMVPIGGLSCDIDGCSSSRLGSAASACDARTSRKRLHGLALGLLCSRTSRPTLPRRPEPLRRQHEQLDYRRFGLAMRVRDASVPGLHAPLHTPVTPTIDGPEPSGQHRLCRPLRTGYCAWPSSPEPTPAGPGDGLQRACADDAEQVHASPTHLICQLEDRGHP
jgi:hypothetical protein